MQYDFFYPCVMIEIELYKKNKALISEVSLLNIS